MRLRENHNNFILVNMATEELDEKFDIQAEKIFSSLQGVRTYDPNDDLDPVWEDPDTHAKVYIGGIHAANTLKILQSHDITSVVNCQALHSANALQGEASLKFHNIPVATYIGQPSFASVEDFWKKFGDFFAFVDNSLAHRQSVLIHCLAGAHRAPTATAVYLLYKSRLSVAQVNEHIKRCRPIADLNCFSGMQVLLHTVLTTLENCNYSRDTQ